MRVRSDSVLNASSSGSPEGKNQIKSERSNTGAGLSRRWHSHFNVPIVDHVGLEDVQFGHFPEAIHRIPAREVESFDLYAKLAPAEELYVSLHGAVEVGRPRYPSFWRVASMRDRVSAFVTIADPTLLLSSNDRFRLGWYTGGLDWDPTAELSHIVRTAMANVGARHVCFLGSSGGGFASMRIATRFPGSMAFVQDPQTSIARFNPIHQRRLAEECWPGWHIDDVLSLHPERFDLSELYSQSDPEHFVYYRQSTSDSHLERHAVPFRDAIQMTAGVRSGDFRFVFEEGERDGHGKITPAEYDRHFAQAVEFWRGRR